MVSLYSIGKFAKETGVSISTLRRWDKEGKLLPAFVSEGGTRYYSDDQLFDLLGKSRIEVKEKAIIGYCRVNSHKQKDDLESQVENVRSYMTAKGYQFEILTDIGSGINYNNKSLNKIIDMVINNQVDKVIILHKDRLVRFGFELIENICKKYNTKIEIIDQTEKTEDQELVEDLIQIVTVFSARLQGKRAHRAKNMIEELTNDDSDKEG